VTHHHQQEEEEEQEEERAHALFPVFEIELGESEPYRLGTLSTQLCEDSLESLVDDPGLLGPSRVQAQQEGNSGHQITENTHRL
jgi:hypothetical protein